MAASPSAALVDSTSACPPPTAPAQHHQQVPRKCLRGRVRSGLLPTPARSARFLAIRRRSRWRVSAWLVTHSHTSPGKAEMHGWFCIQPFLLAGKKNPSLRGDGILIPVTCPPNPGASLQARLTGGQRACWGALPTCPFPSGKRRGVSRAPQKVPAHPGSMLCVSSPLLRV